MTADTALRLGRFSGTSEQFWLTFQKRYDLDLAGDRDADRTAAIAPR